MIQTNWSHAVAAGSRAHRERVADAGSRSLLSISKLRVSKRWRKKNKKNPSCRIKVSIWESPPQLRGAWQTLASVSGRELSWLWGGGAEFEEQELGWSKFYTRFAAQQPIGAVDTKNKKLLERKLFPPPPPPPPPPLWFLFALPSYYVTGAAVISAWIDGFNSAAAKKKSYSTDLCGTFSVPCSKAFGAALVYHTCFGNAGCRLRSESPCSIRGKAQTSVKMTSANNRAPNSLRSCEESSVGAECLSWWSPRDKAPVLPECWPLTFPFKKVMIERNITYEHKRKGHISHFISTLLTLKCVPFQDVVETVVKIVFGLFSLFILPPLSILPWIRGDFLNHEKQLLWLLLCI